MSDADEFQVSLPSNVTGNAGNTPGQYETTLARPFELPGNWEVALIDITYPHSWVIVYRDYVAAVAPLVTQSESSL